MPADDGDARATRKRPIRPVGAPPRPGAFPDDQTVVRPRPITLPRRVLRDESAADPQAPASTSTPALAPVASAPRPATASIPVPAPARVVAEPIVPRPEALDGPAPATVLTHHTIGGRSGQLDLSDPRWSRAGGAKALLETSTDALPELVDDEPPRRLTRQPAFLVSVGAAFVGLVVVVVLILMQTVFRGPDRVENLQLLDGGDNYVLQWNGPDVPYSIVVTGTTSGKRADLSQLIKGGREAFVPKNGAGVTDKSCFVVTSQREADSQAFTTSKAGLAAQGGARVCVSSLSDD